MTSPATTTPARRPRRPRATPIAVPPSPVPLLRVFVPGKPVSTNLIYAARGYRHSRRLTDEAHAWRDAVTLSVMPWRLKSNAPRPTLAVSFVFIGCRSDVDNLIKTTLDGIKDGLAVDDRYVMKVCAEKRSLSAGAERGAWIEVTILPTPAKRPGTRKTMRSI